MPAVRNARAEATARAGEGHEARVLEPSPPAVTDGPYLADDPVAVETADGGTDRTDVSVVVPAGLPGDRDWNDLLANDSAHSQWVASHWLGGARRLPAVPPHLTATRLALHRLAAYVIAPARHAATGKFGLRWTHGGFGTPFFGDDRQIRVEGRTLVDQRGDEVRAAPITSLRAAAEFLETSVDTETAAEHDSPPAADLDEILTVDETASRFLGDWFGMAFAALELLRADDASADPSRPQLWPGHFDPAIEVGDEDHRASYGASPGDAGSDEPYLYVSVWWPDKLGIDPASESDGFWNADGFFGARKPVSTFPADADPVETAAEFWRAARHRLG